MAKSAFTDSKITADGLLADSIVAAENKLFVQGAGWNLLNTPVLPFRYPRIGIGLLLQVPYLLADNMPHRFRLRLEDEDGNSVPFGDAPPGAGSEDGKIRAVEGAFTPGRGPLVQPGDPQILPIAMNIDGLEFQRAGSYLFKFEVDGEEIKALWFRVVHLTQPIMTFGRPA